MAKLVMSLGMSHSPMMALHGSRWAEYAQFDQKHKMLFDLEGNHVTYDELAATQGAPFEKEAEAESLLSTYQQMRVGFERLSEDVKAFAPDVMIVLANDHPNEYFDRSNVPALGVYTGEKVISAKIMTDTRNIRFSREFLLEMSQGLGMDKHHEWPGAKEAALQLTNSLIEQEFDVTILEEDEIPEGETRGHGHGFGTVVTELMQDQLIPMVPVYLNAWPPNELSPSRCYDLGRAIRKAVEQMPSDLRVAFVCSGGLSHFVTDKDIDEQVLQALRERDEEALRQLPKHRMKAGSSEIRNWVVLGGVSEGLDMEWSEYIPVFRTPAGTGIGMGFTRFS